MPNEFRFFLLCLSATSGPGAPIADLSGVVNHFPADDEPIELSAVVGGIFWPEMKGKHLDLMFWTLDKNHERQTVDGFVGRPLILPELFGPNVAPFPLKLPSLPKGTYGCELLDRDGAFGDSGSLIATYMFGAA